MCIFNTDIYNIGPIDAMILKNKYLTQINLGDEKITLLTASSNDCVFSF